MMQRLSPLLLVIGTSLLALLMISCSFNRSFFIINKTDQDWTITIRVDTSIEIFDSDHDFEGALPYLDKTDLKMDFGIRQLLIKKLSYRKLDEQTLQVKLPENSTVYIGGDSSLDKWSFEYLTIEVPGTKVTFSEHDIYKNFKEDVWIGSSPKYYVIE